MRRRRVIAVVVVVAVATIAACLGPSLSSTEQEAVVVQQGSSVDIGNVMVGATGSASITISPASGSSNSMDKVTSVTKGTCPGFALQLPPLPATVERLCSGSGSQLPSGSQQAATGDLVETTCADTVYTFGVTYSPTSAGAASCSITIAGDTFAPLSVTVFANGVAPAFAMDVTPKTINFGDVRVGDSGSQTFNIRNAGTNPLPINQPFTISPSTAYTATAVGSNPIPPAKTETITVTCTPPAATAFNSTLTVSGSAGSQNVTLSCKGITSNLVINPSPLDLTARVGENTQKDIVIQNVGAAPAVLNSIAIVPTVPNVPVSIVSGPAPNTTLGSGSSTTVRVKYEPTDSQPTTELAKLRIMHDTSTQRDVVINGGGLATTMAVFPDAVDFGAVCAGTMEARDVDVKAADAGSFTVSSFTAPTAPFMFRARAGTLLPGLAMANQGNKLEFVALLTGVTPGPLDGEVTLNTDIPNDKLHRIALHANVLPAGVGASPQTMDFGGVLKNTLSSAMSTEVRNCSESPLAIDDVHIEGINAADFSIVIPGPTELQPTLQPHESIKYHVVMRSDTPGAKFATLVVASGASAVKIDLLATALGGGDSNAGGRDTYYQCGVSSGNAGFFVVVVVVGLRLRRRRRR